MTTEQQKTATKVADANKAGFVLTKSGVMFVGNDLLGDKLAALYCEMIQMDDLHGLACLTIRDDNFPFDGNKPVFGIAMADTNSVAINLEECWHKACVVASKGEKNLTFMGILWVNLLDTLAHELDHLVQANNDREMYETMRMTEEGNKELEDTARAASAPMILRMAKELDIEPPAPEAFGWFAVKFMDLFTNESTKDLDWVIKARFDIEAEMIYEDKEKEYRCFTFREFAKQMYTPEKDLLPESNDTATWEQPTTAVNLSAYLDNGVVEEFKAEPVKEPIAETVALAMEEAAEEDVVLVAADTPAEAVVAATGAFIGAGEEGEPEIVITGEDAAVDARIQALIDAPNPQPTTPEVVAQTTVAVEQPVVPVLEPVPAVAAVQAQVAAAAAPPAAAPAPTTFTPHNLSPETMAAVMKAVWQTLHHHVFTKCGWQQEPTTGRFFFSNAIAVLEGVDISSIITQCGAENFIMSYDTLNADGQGGEQYAAEEFTGRIRGRFTQKDRLPSYQIYLNIGGQRIRRSYTPQNPEKRDANNAYSTAANEAAVGNQIAWVFKGEAPSGAPFLQKCAVKLTNSHYEVFSG
jgi:hypothetical protein